MDIKMLAKAKPILMSTPMVQASMSDIDPKTQTRRVIKLQPPQSTKYAGLVKSSENKALVGCGIFSYGDGTAEYIRARYLPGDILWVRETWRLYEKAVGKGDDFRVKQFFAYKADEDNPAVKKCCEWYDNIKPLFGGLHQKYKTGSWRPSIFMPREAARLFLRVTDVRAERLQDITVEDCIAEGIECDIDIKNPDPATHENIRNWNLSYAQFLYKELWDKLNAKRDGGIYAWNMNPWVWIYTFERIAGQ